MASENIDSIIAFLQDLQQEIADFIIFLFDEHLQGLLIECYPLLISLYVMKFIDEGDEIAQSFTIRILIQKQLDNQAQHVSSSVALLSCGYRGVI
jgi:hypothetical protein